MPPLPKITLERYRGDSSILSLPLVDPDDLSPFDPAGCKWLFTIKKDIRDADAKAVVQKDSTIGGIDLVEVDGEWRANVAILPADCSTLEVERGYSFDLQAEDQETAKIKTVSRGVIFFRRDITQETTLSIPTFTTTPAGSLDAINTVSDRRMAATNLRSSSFVSVGADGVYQADACAGRPAHGFVRSATTAGEQVAIHTIGAMNGLSGLTPGARYFLSAGTAGDITSTAPTSGLVQMVGTASATDTLLVDIRPEIYLP